MTKTPLTFDQELGEILTSAVHDLEWIFPNVKGAIALDREKQISIKKATLAAIKAAIKSHLPEPITTDWTNSAENQVPLKDGDFVDANAGWNSYHSEVITNLNLEEKE